MGVSMNQQAENPRILVEDEILADLRERRSYYQYRTQQSYAYHTDHAAMVKVLDEVIVDIERGKFRAIR